MTLYDINAQIMDCIDCETGEVIDIERFNDLSMEKTEKIENIAKLYKNSKAEAEMIANEIKKLAERKKSAENLAESMKKMLATELSGAKFKTAAISISYRKSESVVVEDVHDLDAEFVQYEIRADKKAIKDAIKAGKEVAGATLEESNNIIIK